MYFFSEGSGRTQVDYKIEEIGDDLEISITGGVIHVGGVGLVADGVYNILSVRNHKEFELIQPLADKLKKYNDINILIVAGIHLDEITLDEIREILDNNQKAIEKIDKYISSEYEIFHEFHK